MNTHQTTRSIIVQGRPLEIFALWADVESFPQFMPRLKSVAKTSERTSHWVFDGPLGSDVEWDAEITLFEPGERLAWKSAPGGDIRTSGQVSFEPLPSTDQTQVTLMIQYVPQGALATLGAYLQNDAVFDEALRRFKEHAERRRPVGV
jgi:uncharacterized membrane protein